MAVHSGKDNQPYGEPDENRQSQGAQRPYNGDASFGQQDGWKDVMDTVTDLAGNLAEELGIASGESVRNSAQNLGKQLNKVIDGSTQWLKNTLESNQNASDTPLLAPPRCAPLDEKLVAKNRREGRFRRFMRAEGAGIAVACAIFFGELWWVVPALYLGLYIWMHQRRRTKPHPKLSEIGPEKGLLGMADSGKIGYACGTGGTGLNLLYPARSFRRLLLPCKQWNALQGP